MSDYKYYIIKRGINGKLLEVIGFDKKVDVHQFINKHISLGYQITLLSRAVMLTGSNLFEARERLGLPHPNF